MAKAEPRPRGEYRKFGSLRILPDGRLRFSAWTLAGLFYITQDFVPRMYHNEAVPWQRLFVGWMAAMYICAAFTPAILWAGRR